MTMTGQRLYERARRLIPGGVQLLSKRPEMYLPEQWPAYFSRASGAHVWDLDGNQYIDVESSIGAAILGFADPDVDAAVMATIARGSIATLNAPEEVELAELLCELHPWANMVRYTRAGGEAMMVAVRIARAHTKRSKVAFSGYHGWHDWYLAANRAHDDALDGHLLPGLEPSGVPRELAGTALPFRYNDLADLQQLLEKHRDEIAVVVLEPTRNDPPAPGFLEGVRELATRAGAVLIFDEVTAGFRFVSAGAHRMYGVDPDIAVFAKGLSNGYPMAAIIGRANVMDAAQSTFISSTSWTESIGPVAALATLRKHIANDVGQHLVSTGTEVQLQWKRLAEHHGLHIHVAGMKPISHFDFLCDDARAVHTLFTQTMLEQGFLATNRFYVNFSHRDEVLRLYFTAVNCAFALVADALARGTVRQLLKGPVAHVGFRRLV